jgi:hypothetical protein
MIAFSILDLYSRSMMRAFSRGKLAKVKSSNMIRRNIEMLMTRLATVDCCLKPVSKYVFDVDVSHQFCGGSVLKK